MTQTMTQEIFNSHNSAFTKSPAMTSMIDCLESLKGRWYDEREYEDFTEYVEVFKSGLPAGVTLLKMTKGFHVEIQFENRIVLTFKISLRQATWKYSYRSAK